MNVTTVVLINGLWISALSWELWIQHYSDKSYRVIAADWPGMNRDIDWLRRHPASFAKVGLRELIDHYEQLVREIENPPIIIGHGVGGLVTQVLLDRGWGAAGVAIAPAPVKGVRRFSLSSLKIAFSALGNPFNTHETASLTSKQFRYAFANTLTETESLVAFQRYAVPAPNRVLLQAALANFNRQGTPAINFRNDTRAPLLLVSGDKDRVTPSSSVKANFDLYRESKAETAYKEFPHQTHFSLCQEIKVADYVLDWALRQVNRSTLTAVSNHPNSWSVQLSA